MSDNNKDDYDVGYCKPPKSGQFKKGQSGNPKGRPPKAKGFKASLRAELSETVTVRENGKVFRISKAEAIVKRIVHAGLNGNPKAQMELLKLDDELFGEINANGTEKSPMEDPKALDFEILRDFFVNQEVGDGDDSS